ncbi:MAG: InlB B-repeat-containing protein, partial [Muribaculaceae bacterium]|nr:InlB B-repeat-containing protein [Muribaculaceae bacterium]
SELTFKADSRGGMPSDPFEMSPFYLLVLKIDGETFDTQEIGYGDPVVLPEAPEKEGYTFNGWGDVPATMPAYDIEVHSSYTVNTYSLTFKIDDEEIFSEMVAYGTAIVVPEVPAKDGYLFSGWTDVPETMPANDLVITGSYEHAIFNVVYVVDGEIIHTDQVPYGDTITVFNDVPEKEGYSFSGWSEIPETMPDHDIELDGTYVVNRYIVTFRIDGEEFVSQDLAYQEEIIMPEAPAKEGYTFSGWGNVPEVMPAENLVFEGSYSINTYTVIFRIDQEVFQTLELEYGAEIIAPEAPELEGHTFSGWGEVPATMPAYDLVFVGTFADNYYTVTFRIGDEVIKMADLPYGSEILIPEVPEKEGHTFSGWGDVPATMPASNIEIFGSYTVNNYNVTFRIDDDIIFSGELPYGSEIVAPEAPVKEGYSFSGWGIVPATVPASDLVISGTYLGNNYTLTFLIDGVVYDTFVVAYGSDIIVPVPPVKEGYSLVGWNDVPATMPPYDLSIDGTYSLNSYLLTFKVDEDIIFSGEVPYGTEIVAPEVPAKDGYSFSGWGMVPPTMPASDLEIVGSYELSYYNLTFIVDDEVVYTAMLPYGADIVAPYMPDSDGKSFSGWGDIPAVMPAYDLTLTGTYGVNFYQLTFKICGEIIYSGEIAYGAPIVVPEVPDKEGHSFSGWGNVPETMPSRNLEFTGDYYPDTYTLIFKIDGEVISEEPMLYGSDITAPDAPEKEGYSFSGWGIIPSVMPAQDVEVSGTYELNSYSIVFKIGEDVLYSSLLNYGAPIVVPDVPEKEGSTFSGWGEVPEVMPAKDLEFVGNYIQTLYNIIFKIDGEVVLESKLPYGAEIVVPAVEDKEGYSFSGWGVVPATMPASDIEFSGTYDVISYNVIFKIGDDVVYSAQLPYGSEIVAPEVPDHEGYSFSGWGEVPTSVPAHDVEIQGSYSINLYHLTVYLNDEIYLEEDIEYGAAIIIPEPEVEVGSRFEGWQEEIPETMPAHDVVIHGVVLEGSAVDSIGDDASEITVVSVNGIVIFKNAKADEVKDQLAPGLYIINGKKVLVNASR